MQRLPKLIAFDLDDTLWYPEMYQLNGGPFTKDASGKVYDRSKTHVKPYKDGLEVIRMIHTEPQWAESKVGYASRTEYPDWAMECLSLIDIAPHVSMKEAAHFFEIYPGNKRAHFKRFHEESGIPYEDMIFFDNERRNCTDVAHLGVVTVYTPGGMTMAFWEQGLREFASNTKHRR